MHKKARLSGFHTHKSDCKLSLGLLSYCCSKIDISRVKGGCHAKWMDWVFRLSSKLRQKSDPTGLPHTRAPEGAAWRCRGIVAWREQVCGGQTIYGHHFPAARVSARAHSRVKACLCTCAGKPGAPLEAWGCIIVDRALSPAGEHGKRIVMT